MYLSLSLLYNFPAILLLSASANKTYMRNTAVGDSCLNTLAYKNLYAQHGCGWQLS